MNQKTIKIDSILVKEITVEEYDSGIIMIIFDCTKKYANVFRNSKSLFTVSIIEKGIVKLQNIVTIPELENIGVDDYYTTYSTEKEQAIIHCIPDKYYFI